MQNDYVEIVPINEPPSSYTDIGAIRSLAMVQRDPGTIIRQWNGDAGLWMQHHYDLPEAQRFIDILDFCAASEGTLSEDGGALNWNQSFPDGKLSYVRRGAIRAVTFSTSENQVAKVLDTTNPKKVTFVPGPIWVIGVLKFFKALCEKQVSDQALALYKADSTEQAAEITAIKALAANV